MSSYQRVCNLLQERTLKGRMPTFYWTASKNLQRHLKKWRCLLGWAGQYKKMNHVGWKSLKEMEDSERKSIKLPWDARIMLNSRAVKIIEEWVISQLIGPKITMVHPQWWQDLWDHSFPHRAGAPSGAPPKMTRVFFLQVLTQYHQVNWLCPEIRCSNIKNIPKLSKTMNK